MICFDQTGFLSVYDWSRKYTYLAIVRHQEPWQGCLDQAVKMQIEADKATPFTNSPIVSLEQTYLYIL